MKETVFISLALLVCMHVNGQTQIESSSIYYNGPNVGIGTSNPSSKLHVFTGLSGGSPHSFSKLTIEHNDNAMISILTPSDKVGYFGFADSDDQFVGGMMYSHISDNLTFRVNNHNYDMVIKNNGYIGIGTSDPRFPLDIKTYSNYEGHNHYFGSRRYYMAGVTGNGTQMYGGFVLNNLGSGKRAFEVVVDHDNDFDVNKNPENYIATFLSTGNVGINERDPKYRLTVGGTVSATEVKVSTTPNSDYVFGPQYNLRPLTEVENYIKENQHLPDIPSAEEFKQDGVGLGEMDDMLLRKVEELVLYTIKQQKELEEYKERLGNLENENENLKKENEKQNVEIERLKGK